MAGSGKKTKSGVTFDFKKIDTWDLSFLGVLVIVLSVNFSLLSSLEQLPGPLYGGDVYFHYGHVNHIADGGNIFGNSQYKDEYEFYNWLTHLSIAIVSWIIPGAGTFAASVAAYPLLITIISGVVLYTLGQKLLGSKPIAVLLSFLWISRSVPTLTPSITANFLTVPILFLFLYYAKTLRERIVAGIVLGLAGLQHLIPFLAGFIALGLLFLSRLGRHHFSLNDSSLKLKKSGFSRNLVQEVNFFLPIAFIGTAIAMLYLFPPLFIYGGETPNPWQEYTGQGVTSVNITSMLQVFLNVFFSWHGVIAGILSVLAIAGAYSAFKYKKAGLPWLVLMTGLIGYIHPLITIPLTGNSYGYYRFPTIVLPFARYLFIGLGMLLIYRTAKPYGKWIGFGALGMLLAVSGFSFHSDFNSYKNNQWTKAAFSTNEALDSIFGLGGFVRKNTDVNDVFLATHEESGFAINALSGRKVVFLRRTHASPYVSANKRIADAAVMLYGNDTGLARQLLKEYDVKYFYEDFYSSDARRKCLQAWNTMSQMPDLSYNCLRTSPEFAGYLEGNGIEYQKVKVRIDPASSVAPRFDMLAIKPAAMDNFQMTQVYQASTSSGPAAFVMGVVS